MIPEEFHKFGITKQQNIQSKTLSNKMNRNRSKWKNYLNLCHCDLPIALKHILPTKQKQTVSSKTLISTFNYSLNIVSTKTSWEILFSCPNGIFTCFTIFGSRNDVPKCRAYNFRSNHQRCSIKKLFLKFSQYSQEKHLCWSLFLITLQAWRSATLFKRDSNKGVFMWILRNF